MNRRKAIGRMVLFVGGSIIASDYLLSGCKAGSTRLQNLFDPQRIAFLDEIAETIIPATNTPGAKAARAGNFMAVMVRDCFEAPEQEIFMNGLDNIEYISNRKFNKGFMDITQQQRTILLSDLDKEQSRRSGVRGRHRIPGDPNHYFPMMKQLVVSGYFKSEIGCTKALRYLPVPGHYDGCIPYSKGDKAWAT